MPTKEEVWQALLSAFPEPDDADAYVPALYYSQMAEALAGLSKVYADAFSDAVYQIQKQELTSSVYALVEHFRDEWPHGFVFEIEEVVRCIREGKTEADSMPLDDTLQVLEITDQIRAQWGLVYPQERE